MWRFYYYIYLDSVVTSLKPPKRAQCVKLRQVLHTQAWGGPFGSRALFLTPSPVGSQNCMSLFIYYGTYLCRVRKNILGTN